MRSAQNIERLPSLVLKVSNVFDNFLVYLNLVLSMSWINFIFHHICAVTDSTESAIESVSLNISQTNVLEKDDALQNVEPAFFQPNESMRSISEDIETVTKAKRPRGNVNDVNDLIENDILLDESDSETQNIIDWNDIAWEKAVGKRMDCDDLIYPKDEKHLYGKNKVLKNGDIAYLCRLYSKKGARVVCTCEMGDYSDRLVTFHTIMVNRATTNLNLKLKLK